MTKNSYAKLNSFTIIFLFNLFLPGLAHANDGFYQGAGDTLFPVRNKYLRVVKEELKISYIHIKQRKCYDVFYKGKKASNLKAEAPSYAFGTLKPASNYKKISFLEQFCPRWKATAVYEVFSSKEQKNVQMGFPVPTWDFTDNSGMPLIQVPGAVNFKTYIDGKEIRNTKLKWLKAGNIKNLYGDKVLGYTWHANYGKSTKHILKTEYEFSVDYSIGFYEDREYMKGKRPWFVPQPDDNNLGHFGAAQTMQYYLTPLQLWSPPPPSSINIDINLPGNLPVTYAVFSLGMTPTCIDTHSLHFEIKNRFPETDLKISYPAERWEADRIFDDVEGWDKLSQILTQENWDKWIQSNDLQETKFTCGFIENMQIIAEKELEQTLQLIDCVKSCR